MTPEQIAEINRKIPGFAGMSPEQQQNILNRLRAGQNTQQQQKPTTADQVSGIAPAIGVQAGYQALTSGAGATAAGTASGTAAGGTTAAGSGGYTAGAGSFAVPAALGAVGYNQFKQNGGKEVLSGTANRGNNVDATLGSNVLTAAINPVAKFLGGKSVGEMLTGGKSKDQTNRDVDRKTLQKGGILDDDYNLTLSDGSKVNLGLDGSVKNYNVDFNEKGIGDIVALVNPFAYIVTGGDSKRASDLNGQITNAIKTSKNPKAELEAMFNKAGLFKDDALARIDALKVDDQTKAVFKNTLNGLNIPNSTDGQKGSIPATGSPGFKLVINQVNAPTPKQVSAVPGIRNSILQNMLSQNTQPIQYPSQNPNYNAKNFNGTLQKLVGI